MNVVMTFIRPICPEADIRYLLMQEALQQDMTAMQTRLYSQGSMPHPAASPLVAQRMDAASPPSGSTPGSHADAAHSTVRTITGEGFDSLLGAPGAGPVQKHSPAHSTTRTVTGEGCDLLPERASMATSDKHAVEQMSRPLISRQQQAATASTPRTGEGLSAGQLDQSHKGTAKRHEISPLRKMTGEGFEELNSAGAIVTNHAGAGVDRLHNASPARTVTGDGFQHGLEAHGDSGARAGSDSAQRPATSSESATKTWTGEGFQELNAAGSSHSVQSAEGTAHGGSGATASGPNTERPALSASAIRTWTGEGFQELNAAGSSHSVQSTDTAHGSRGATATGDLRQRPALSASAVRTWTGEGFQELNAAGASEPAQAIDGATKLHNAPTLRTVTGEGFQTFGLDSPITHDQWGASLPRRDNQHPAELQNDLPARTVTGEGFQHELGPSRDNVDSSAGRLVPLVGSSGPATRTWTGEGFQKLNEAAPMPSSQSNASGVDTAPLRAVTGEGFELMPDMPAGKDSRVGANRPASAAPPNSAASAGAAGSSHSPLRAITGEGLDIHLSRPSTSSKLPRPDGHASAAASHAVPSAAAASRFPLRAITGEGLEAELSRQTPSSAALASDSHASSAAQPAAPLSAIVPQGPLRAVTGAGLEAHLSRPTAGPARPDSHRHAPTQGPLRAVTGEGLEAHLSRPTAGPALPDSQRHAPPHDPLRAVTGEGLEAHLSRSTAGPVLPDSQRHAPTQGPLRAVTGEGLEAHLSRPTAGPALPDSQRHAPTQGPLRAVTGEGLEALLSRPTASAEIHDANRPAPSQGPLRVITGEGLEALLSPPTARLPAAATVRRTPDAVHRATGEGCEAELSTPASKSQAPGANQLAANNDVTGAGARPFAQAAHRDLLSPSDREHGIASPKQSSEQAQQVRSISASPANKDFIGLLGDLSPGLPPHAAAGQPAVQSSTVAAPEAGTSRALHGGALRPNTSGSSHNAKPAQASAMASSSQEASLSDQASGLQHPSKQQLPAASPTLSRRTEANLGAAGAAPQALALQPQTHQRAMRLLTASLDGLASSPLDPEALQPSPVASGAAKASSQDARGCITTPAPVFPPQLHEGPSTSGTRWTSLQKFSINFDCRFNSSRWNFATNSWVAIKHWRLTL